ncbi:MAG: hypothetical protein ACT4P2_01480 [Pseudomonadota bacterium]
MIDKLLGHTQVQTITRNGHLAADPANPAANRISANIAAVTDALLRRPADAFLLRR